MEGKKIYERESYLQLIKPYQDAQKELYRREELLRTEIFSDLDAKKRLVELELEKEFGELWSDFGVKGYFFNKFRFDFNIIAHGHHYFKVMGLTTPNSVFDLEKIAKSFPIEKRSHNYLQASKEYKETSEKIESELDIMGFYDLKMPIKIQEFWDNNGILKPKIEYFKE